MGLVLTKKDDDIKDINDTVEAPVKDAVRLSAFDMSELTFE